MRPEPRDEVDISPRAEAGDQFFVEQAERKRAFETKPMPRPSMDKSFPNVKPKPRPEEQGGLITKEFEIDGKEVLVPIIKFKDGEEIAFEAVIQKIRTRGTANEPTVGKATERQILNFIKQKNPTREEFETYWYNKRLNKGGMIDDQMQMAFMNEGGLAGDGTDDGTNNVAVGFEALSANCGSSNVAVGCRAGKAITGASNTVVGLSAGTNVSSGEHNTLMGKEAGTVIEAGDYNVIIGADSDTDHQNAQSRLVLGFGVENPTDNSVRIGSGGNFISNTFTSNATWAHSSDERLKENIQNDTLGLSFIKDLRPVTFTWKRQADVPEELKSDARFEKATGTHHGIIAQEVKSALDTAGVSTFTGWSSDEGDGTQLVSESMFVYPLVKAVQELSTALDAALARIATLEG